MEEDKKKLIGKIMCIVSTIYFLLLGAYFAFSLHWCIGITYLFIVCGIYGSALVGID